MSLSRADIDQYKRTILQAVAENRAHALRTYLGESGLNVDVVCNSQHQNLLQVAAFHGAEETVELMLRYDRVVQVINNRDRSNRTALHLAAATGYGSIVKRLLDAKARLDIQDEEGHTALHLAVKFEWPDTVGVLLDAGADPMLEDLQGQTSLDMANAKADKRFITLMASHAGKRKPPTGLQGFRRCLLPLWGKDNVEEEESWANLSVAEWLANGSVRDDAGRPIQRPEWAPEEEEEQLPVPPVQELASSAQPAATEGQGLRRAGLAHSGGAAQFTLQFDEKVARLEFEVEWGGQEPVAGNVKPGGAAESRGLVTGDRLVEIAGQRTKGRGRQDLLPLLKQRPLIIKVERPAKGTTLRD